jgi:ribulose 1,5-bisphosphate synthetase/thiazole synthase
MIKKENLSCDVLVAGGGISGVLCALAAARNGAKVILCQDRPVLGGNASSEIRMNILGAEALGKRGIELQVEPRESGILEEIRLDTCVQNPQRSATMFDLVLYDKCRTQQNLTLMLNTTITGVEMKNGKIKSATAERQSTEDVFEIAAKIFVDCTGDGRLALEAGAAFRMGRESKEEFKESLAPDKADNRHMGASILFHATKHDHPMPFVPPKWARKFTEEDLKHRPHAMGMTDLGEYHFCALDFGYWWLEWGGQADTIKDGEKVRDELMAILFGVWDHIKNTGNHGAENWAIDWFGAVPGKRESRRFVGQYTLTQADVLESRVFDDAIAYGGWSIDDHPWGGIDAKDEIPGQLTAVPYLYNIPLRCCVSRDVSNLMFAGRNISVTHVAFGSIRVMGTCGVIGQGVGTAAAYAIKNNVEPSVLSANSSAMKEIQQQLLRDDAYLVGIRNEDKNDIARQAKVTASSEQKDGKASNVISGQTRAVFGDKGAPPDRAYDGTHRWMSESSAKLPAWIELKWDEPKTVSQIELIFDTGMHRMLTLTQIEGFVHKMIWGKAQPETVRDYTIEGLVNGKWTKLTDEKNNFQRRRVHNLDKTQMVSAIRVNVTATNGLDHARIMEIRVY